MPVTIIPFPTEFRPALPNVVGNVDYQTLCKLLEQIEHLLLAGGLETQFVEYSLEKWLGKGRKVSAGQQQRFQARSRRALRCNILRTLLQQNYRDFSVQLASAALFQRFCLIDTLALVRVPSKSELQRFSTWIAEDKMRSIINQLLGVALEKPATLKLETALDLESYFVDSTCLKTNIHFPTDWVLLIDGVRTLMKATILIRKQGIKGRMEAPEEFMKRMNRLCMEMSYQARQEDSKRKRKKTLRKMKKIVKAVRSHARRHRELLQKRWQETTWSQKQANQVINRIDRVLELLPKAQKQAHDRIIGERLVRNEEKILSLYETDTRIMVRRKASAEVEFGNKLLLGENSQGLILDYKLYRDCVPGDSIILVESLERIVDGLKKKVQAVVTDRGFTSKINSNGLKEAGMFNGTCPRQPEELQERMKDKRFAKLQKRRSQTEARIGIIKENFLGTPMRSKGFEHREVALSWGVLTHNLWMLARMQKVEVEEKRQEAA